jgi:hypothetical protein
MHPVPATRLARPLLTGLSPRVLADGTIALGADPVHGVVVTGASLAETSRLVRLLTRLAGLSGPAILEDLATTTGLPVGRVEELCRALDHAGLTMGHPFEPGGADQAAWSVARRHSGGESSLSGPAPLPVPRRRAGARVVVDGGGSLVHDIARLLRSAGVGEVRAGRYAAVADDQDSDTADPALVVSVSPRLPRERSRDWSRRGVTHLPVLTRTGSVDIGPLVVPGSGPCLHCVSLAESGGGPELDVHDDLVADGQGETVTVEVTLASVAAGTVAMIALGVTDAYPPPPGLRWHTALPLPSLATSRWSIHPRCPAPAHRHRRGAEGPATASQLGPSVQGGRMTR